MTENAEALLKDPNRGKSKEHFSSAVRVLELVQTNEIEMLLETIIGVNIIITPWVGLDYAYTFTGPPWQGEGDAGQ